MHRFIFALLCAVSLGLGQQPEKAKPKLGEWTELRFTESPPQSDAAQIKLRFRSKEDPDAYDVSQEVYDLLVPKGYKASVAHGLFIWISAGPTVKLLPEWEKVLADRRMIAVGARNSGNDRDVFDRVRLAIDGNHNLRGLYNVDGRRVYVAGFSGGARVASMVGVTYAEMFSGAACFMGVNFYEPVVGPDQMVYQARYIPVDEILEMAKGACRYSLITAEKDFNLPNTRAVHQAMQAAGFSATQLLNVPALGHSMPSAEWLEKSLKFLDEGKKPLP
jgi:predicted esterase